MTHDLSKHPRWTREEFVTFLLLYCADADMECTDNERAMIRAGIDEAGLLAVETEYKDLKDFEKILVIESYQSRYFSDEIQKKELLKIMERLFKADGEFDIMEHNLYRMLQKLL